MLAMLAAATALPLPVPVPTPVPLPDYQPGDSFVFSDGRVEQVREVNGDTIVWSRLRGETYEKPRNFLLPITSWRNGRSFGSRRVLGSPDKLWPITGRGSARFRVITEFRTTALATPTRSVSLWMCSNAKPRRITVPAGTFSTIPFQCKRYSTTTMRPLQRLEWDYAPAVGHYVRRSSINYVRGTRQSVELVAQLSGPGATAARLKAIANGALRDTEAARGR